MLPLVQVWEAHRQQAVPLVPLRLRQRARPLDNLELVNPGLDNPASGRPQPDFLARQLGLLTGKRALGNQG